MIKYTIIALLLFVGISLTVVFSQDENITAELNALVDENLRATQAEDMDAMLLTLHSDSPAYQQTKQMSEVLFPQYDLIYEKLIFRFIGLDGDYALGRFKFCATKIAGAEFQDNCLDTIHVFKQENGNWKIWSMATLEIEFTNQ
ncbi:hypothetical protein JT359_09055 [Candidatus Poribacteria bacterium]|nr:hypothetical protein [Candidatus Poribacteria bacterium]